MKGYSPFMGRWTGLGAAGLTASAGTAITALVAPMRGAISHVNELSILAGGTAHTAYLFRPLNWTTVASGAASGQTSVVLSANPGTYTTNYQYPLGPAIYNDLAGNAQGPVASATVPVTFQVANLTLASGHYFVFETPDGAFYFDFITAFNTGTLTATMNSNLPTGGLAAGAKAWLMGTTTTLDPATAAKQWNFLLTASSANTLTAVAGQGADFFATLHPYDPILLYDANATAADTVLRFEGFYGKY